MSTSLQHKIPGVTRTESYATYSVSDSRSFDGIALCAPSLCVCSGFSHFQLLKLLLMLTRRQKRKEERHTLLRHFTEFVLTISTEIFCHYLKLYDVS